MHIDYFIQWLQYRMKEFVITQQELADALGKDKKTIERYLNGESFPKNEQLRQEIIDKSYTFVCQKAKFKTYHHIDNATFLQIFRKYFNFLNQNPETQILQREMAKAIGVSQKTISEYVNPHCEAKLSAELQYKLLNVLASRSFKNIYTEKGWKIDFDSVPEFSYTGHIFSQPKTEHVNPHELFLFMQNGEVFAEIDRLMKSYLFVPVEMHSILENQFDACFRYAEVLPDISNFSGIENENQLQQRISTAYQQCDLMTFTRIYKKIISALGQKIERNADIPKIKNPVSTQDIILQHQLNAIERNHFPFSLKEQQNAVKQFYSTLKTMLDSETFSTFMEQLHKDMFSILQHVKPLAQRKQKKIYPSKSEVVTSLCCFQIDFQDFLLAHNETCFDFPETTQTELNQHITYLFMRKLHFLDTETLHKLITEAEKDFSSGLFLFLISKPDENQKFNYSFGYMQKNYDVFRNFLGKYIEMSAAFPQLAALFNKVETNSEGMTVNYSEKNKQIFEKIIPESLCQNAEISDIIQYKMMFSPEMWYLWGLMQTELLLNPQKAYESMFNILGNADEILTLMNQKDFSL